MNEEQLRWEAAIDQNAHLIPPHMVGGLKRYVLRGIPMGDFGHKLLSNDFMGAMGRADEDNARALQGWAVMFYNYVPSDCYGSPEKVKAWIAQGGLSIYGEAESC